MQTLLSSPTAIESLCLCILLFAGVPRGDEPPILAAPDLRVVKVTTPDTIAVEVTNRSQTPMRLWKESNTWGVARWRLLRMRDAKVDVFYQFSTDIFTRNVPSFQELAIDASITKVLKLTDETWRAATSDDRSVRVGDLIVILYDVPRSDEATRFNVWQGVAVTTYRIAQ